MGEVDEHQRLVGACHAYLLDRHRMRKQVVKEEAQFLRLLVTRAKMVGLMCHGRNQVRQVRRRMEIRQMAKVVEKMAVIARWIRSSGIEG